MNTSNFVSTWPVLWNKHSYLGSYLRVTSCSDRWLVQGEYFVLLPDGRLQTVKYTVGKYGGYVAHVRERSPI